jgi:hypothetical protein
MQVMNVDAELLERSAAAKHHAQVETEIHIAAEVKGDIPELMETLSPQGPYAYSILPVITPDGRVKLPVVSTREGVQEAYEFVRGMSYLHSSVPMTEIQGEWYTFHDGISRTELKSNGDKDITHLLVLFPSGRDAGITGELAWIYCDPSRLGAPEQAVDLDKDDIFIREDLFNLHEAYLEGLRLNDVDAVLDTLNDYVASAMRDYVDDNGSLMSIEGKDAHRLRALLRRVRGSIGPRTQPSRRHLVRLRRDAPHRPPTFRARRRPRPRVSPSRDAHARQRPAHHRSNRARHRRRIGAPIRR